MVREEGRRSFLEKRSPENEDEDVTRASLAVSTSPANLLAVTRRSERSTMILPVRRAAQKGEQRGLAIIVLTVPAPVSIKDGRSGMIPAGAINRSPRSREEIARQVERGPVNGPEATIVGSPEREPIAGPDLIPRRIQEDLETGIAANLVRKIPTAARKDTAAALHPVPPPAPVPAPGDPVVRRTGVLLPEDEITAPILTVAEAALRVDPLLVAVIVVVVTEEEEEVGATPEEEGETDLPLTAGVGPTTASPGPPQEYQDSTL
jgi:hypothetical protein